MAKYQYETSPRKIKVDYDEPKEKSSRKQKNQKIAKTKPINQAKILFYIAIGFVTLFVISYRYAVIDKTYSNLKNLKTELAAMRVI